jgi:methionyl-tRNA formyltransferase
MKVVFMGTPQFAVVSLKKLISEKINIVGIVTATDKPAGRGQKLNVSPVKEVALNNKLPLWQPENLKDPDFIADLNLVRPDLIVVVAFRILPPEVFMLPRAGTINLHASLLPKYRGAAPINWAIINGEKETGVTTFFIDEKDDTGNIIDSVRVQITPDMTAGELHDLLAGVGADLLLHTVHLIEKGEVSIKTQDSRQATKAPKIFPQDCEIDFNQPAQKVHNFIRGLSPYPAAYSFLDGRQIKLFTTRTSSKSVVGSLSGEIIALPGGKSILIQCSEGSIEVSEIQLAGKKRMSVDAFLRGYELKPGKILGEQDAN